MLIKSDASILLSANLSCLTTLHAIKLPTNVLVEKKKIEQKYVPILCQQGNMYPLIYDVFVSVWIALLQAKKEGFIK